MKAKPGSHAGSVVFEIEAREAALTAAAMAAEPADFSLNRILVPMDFSGCARKALRYAIPLAREHGAELVLLHVVAALAPMAAEYGGADNIGLENSIRTAREKDLKELAEAEVPPEVRSRCVVKVGVAETEIVAFAKGDAADLIVISTHGRTGLKHILMGSAAEYTVRHAPCPVLVVRERERDFAPMPASPPAA